MPEEGFARLKRCPTEQAIYIHESYTTNVLFLDSGAMICLKCNHLLGSRKTGGWRVTIITTKLTHTYDSHPFRVSVAHQLGIVSMEHNDGRQFCPVELLPYCPANPKSENLMHYQKEF